MGTGDTNMGWEEVDANVGKRWRCQCWEEVDANGWEEVEMPVVGKRWRCQRWEEVDANVGKRWRCQRWEEVDAKLPPGTPRDATELSSADVRSVSLFCSMYDGYIMTHIHDIPSLRKTAKNGPCVK